MATPIWTPELTDVGAYVTARTTTVGPGNTFTADTYPTADQVDGIIGNVCAWVSARVGVVDESLEDLATMAAALRTAGLVQLSYPVREGDVENAAELLKQATEALDTLEASQERNSSTGTLRPKGKFPTAPLPVCDWADSPRASRIVYF